MTSVTSLGVTNYITQLRTCHDFINLCKQLAKWLRKSFFLHIFVVGRYPSVIKGCMLPSQVPWAEEEHVLGLVTGASGVSQALVLDPPLSHIVGGAPSDLFPYFPTHFSSHSFDSPSPPLPQQRRLPPPQF